MKKTMCMIAFWVMLTLATTAQLAAPVKWSTRNPQNCYDQPVDIKSIGGNELAATISGTKKFIWEYTTVDPSTTPSPGYQVLATTVTDSVFFYPYNSFPPGQQSQISVQSFRYIRVKLVQVHPATGMILTTIAISNPTPIQFSPAAPYSNVPEVLATEPSCTNIPTGAIHLDITKTTDTILYIVRNGMNNNGFCNPETGNPPCFNVVKSGRTTLSSFTITGLPPGTFTVLLANTGAGAGSCYAGYTATVAPQPPIRIDTAIVQHPKCFGDSTGRIQLLVSGGNRATYRFAISPAQPASAFSYANGEANWNNLKAGSYTISFTDTCGLSLTRSITLTQPPRVTGSVGITVPTCNNPGNGAIRVRAGYNIASPGFNRFDYRLYKNGVLYDSLLNTPDTLFSRLDLTTALYRVRVTAPQTPYCTGLDEQFTLPVAPLTIAADSIKAVNCNGGTDGYIRVRAAGGTGQYVFTLKRAGTGFTATDSAGVFQNLAAGSYTATVMNRSACLDSAGILITLTQPDTIAVTVSKTDVQCKGMDNGRLNASATGGNPAAGGAGSGYEYRWQISINNNWTAYFQTGSSITGVAPGVYRSSVRDPKNCVGYSVPVTVSEPDSLKIDSIRVQDIPCIGGAGRITLYGSGGTMNASGGYTQLYRQLPLNQWTIFSPATGLAAGQYQVRLLDARGCTVTSGDTITITSPPTTLDFTYQQTIQNGYHITCFGAANGSITIAATGGNGGGYSGYWYRYDNQPWQTGNTLTGIPGGTRNIQVRDARSCVVTKAIVFVQPSDSLQLSVLTTTNVLCYGAASGQIRVKAGGGVRPYQYNITGGVFQGVFPGTFQTDSTFNNLPAGSYTVAVKDTNGCMGYVNVTLIHLNPQLVLTTTTTAVSCTGGSNGSISTTATGGVAPYSFNWTPGGQTTGTISNLTAGIYNLTITDNAGCINSYPITVAEPAALAPVVTARPVCYGAATGSIRIQPVGGTAPYRYSKDNGVSFGTDSVFNNLAAGTYPIVVRDAKNCVFSTPSTVGVISQSPNLNFLISSNQHALDTLVMKEISWVKPDSVLWQYHPAAIVIDPDRTAPKIRFLSPDTANAYWVRLIGYYPGCTYTTQKNIRIYPYNPSAVVTPADYNRGIKTAELFPNPNNGQFTLNVAFYKLQRATVYITDVTGFIVIPAQSFAPTLQLTKNYLSEMNGKQPGTYILRIVSDYDSRNILFVKQ
jgi:SprB repeat